MIDLATRTLAEEQMDALDLPEPAYAALLADMAQVNTMVLSARPTLAFLNRVARRGDKLRLLDVGFGHGDMLRRVARWAERRGVSAELVGVDLNPRSAKIARKATDHRLPIDFLAGDYAGQAGGRWDVVMSSMVAHHMSHDQLIAFLRFMEAESARGWLVNDLLRHRFAYAGFPLLARAMRWHRIVREDGQLSVARSYRPHEWLAIFAEAGISAARVHRVFPFRLCVERLR